MESRLLKSILIFTATCLSIIPSNAFQVQPNTRIKGRRNVELHMNKKKRQVRSTPKGFGGAIRDLQLNTFRFAGSVKAGKQTPQRTVKDPSIKIPDYAMDGVPKTYAPRLPWVIEVKNEKDIEKMRAAGRVAREVLDIGGRAVKAGATTDEIDALVHEATLERGAYPSPLNYRGFPKSCCTSVNEVICHGIPDDRKLIEGDVINVDITCYLDGYHGDCSEMFVVGETDDDSKLLIQATYDCWIKACQFVEPGRDYKDIGAIIEDWVTPLGLATVRNFCGHGIGQTFHTNPNIYHYRNSEPNGQMAVGHTFTIEPMICQGTAKCLSWPDEWTVTTQDGKRTAQFEHTLLITPDGVEALTGKIDTSPVQFWEKESKVHKGIWLGTNKSARDRESKLNEALN